MEKSGIHNPLLDASDLRDEIPLLDESDCSESLYEVPTKKSRISEPVKYIISIG